MQDKSLRRREVDSLQHRRILDSESVPKTGTMNSSIRVCVKQVGLWCILVIAVVLLTLLFTVLGTITCAVLTGMMMAAARHHRWQTIPVSAVFPGVVIALVGLAKVELMGRQRIFLPALCFGAFWLTYGVTRAVVKFEAAPGAEPEVKTISQPEKGVSEALEELRLENLQGKWICEELSGNGAAPKRILELTGETLSLSTIDPDGLKRVIAKGNVKLENSQPQGRAGTTPTPAARMG